MKNICQELNAKTCFKQLKFELKNIIFKRYNPIGRFGELSTIKI